MGGDFNEIPPGSVQSSNFLDERTQAICSDEFEQPPYTPQIMQPFYDTFIPWVNLDRYGTTAEQQKQYFTHSVLGPNEENETGQQGEWNRTLDYLFASSGSRWKEGTTDVLQNQGQVIGGDMSPLNWTLENDPFLLSDHAPTFGVWEVSP